MRTAVAAGVQAVLLPPETVDPFAPKVLRSAMGAHFRLPVHSLDWTDLRLYIKPANTQYSLITYLADSSGGVPHTRADFQSALALIIGGEAEGARDTGEIDLGFEEIHAHVGVAAVERAQPLLQAGFGARPVPAEK